MNKLKIKDIFENIYIEYIEKNMFYMFTFHPILGVIKLTIFLNIVKKKVFQNQHDYKEYIS